MERTAGDKSAREKSVKAELLCWYKPIISVVFTLRLALWKKKGSGHGRCVFL